MYDVLRKDTIHNLSIKCQLDLLDKIVKPILLYKCEITNHRLSVEVGEMEKNIRENRFGHLCSRRKLGDKYHYIFECTKFIIEIKLYFYFVHRN